jgi:hypothetical protein
MSVEQLGEQVMQEERRCPRCKHGRHKEHVAEFLNKANAVTVCRCGVCVMQTVKRPSVAELEMAQ